MVDLGCIAIAEQSLKDPNDYYEFSEAVIEALYTNGALDKKPDFLRSKVHCTCGQQIGWKYLDYLEVYELIHYCKKNKTK